VVDPNEIETLANAVASAEFLGVDPNPLPIQVTEYVELTAYIDSRPAVSFVIWNTDLRLKDGHVYRIYGNPEFPRLLARIGNRYVPFQDRLRCAANLRSLRGPLTDAMGAENRYPPPATWCDIMDEYRRTQYPSRERITWSLKCPAQKGRCHYAINPNCEPNSPPDMVLLFETKAGWNHHGGPELFTFDNHDPRGGCVLLNDGTVKFIRTEEEVNQLPWR
jgi:hypothetical protein